ncbi:MAG: peptidoglycan-binding domain-containing protein [Chthoniobacterales bacterium]
MKRFFLGLLVIGLFGVGPAVADDNLRAAQSRLKEAGFYFGEVNGAASSETAAAITRYQIRNGLQISGQLDAMTAKSLGLAPAAPGNTMPPPAASSDTWRRLRRTDQQFLRQLNAREAAPPARAEVRTAPSQPPKTETQTFVLSQERLRDYVGAFVLAGLSPGVTSELEFFADRVSYFGDGIVGHERIRRDLCEYNRKWPDRRFWLAGEVRVEPRADSRLRVTFPIRYELRNGSKRSSGKVLKTLVVEVTGEDLQIVGVNERKA